MYPTSRKPTASSICMTLLYYVTGLGYGLKIFLYIILFPLQEHWLSFEDMAFHENGSVSIKYHPVYRGVYHIHYSRYLKYFNKDQILVVDGDLFMKDPYLGCKQVEQFLGLPPFIERDHFVFSHRKHFFCKRIKGKTICLGSNKGRKHTVIANQTLDKMRKFYRPHNKIFEKMLNYKFSWP